MATITLYYHLYLYLYLHRCRCADEAIGTITSHAREVLGEDLVVVVSSDNGASTWEGGLNSPLRSGKFSPFEGLWALVLGWLTVCFYD